MTVYLTWTESVDLTRRHTNRPSTMTWAVMELLEYPVKELGRVLPRILHFMPSAVSEETIMFAKKIYPMVSGRCLLPTWINEISHTSCQESWACPHSLSSLMPLQMGWTESPGYVCAATKTGCNILHALIDGDAVLHLHVMLDCFMTPNTPVQQQTRPNTKRPSVSITKY
jgi:hypothetical protein